MNSKYKKPRDSQVTWAEAVRDMVIAAINRGQLPIFGFFFIVTVILIRMPGEDVSKLAFGILDDLKRGELIAYIVLSGVTIGWFFYAKMMRRTFSKEAERIGKVKSELQKQAANTEFRSSDMK